MKKFLKISSYYFSLLPLWVLFLIQYGFQNILIILGGLYVIIAVINFIIIKSKLKSSKIPVKITDISNGNNEQLLYLMTYIIPFVFINYQETNGFIDYRTISSISFLLVIIGFIYCKTNLFSANPVLSILGRNTYKGTINVGDKTGVKCTIISRGHISFQLPAEKSVLYLIDDEVLIVLNS